MIRAVAVGAAVAALVLCLAVAGGGPLVGADRAAPDYDRWATPAWTPPGAAGEPLLFALQAGIGGGLLTHYLGRLRADPGAAGES